MQKKHNLPPPPEPANPKIETLSLFDLPHSFSHLKFEETDENVGDGKIQLQAKENNTTISLSVYKRIFELNEKKNKYEEFDEERLKYMHPEDRPPVAKRLTYFEQMTVKTWIVLLCHGGYFAGAVFQQKKPIAHKSFHHYVTRKKQGGRQSNKDKSKKPKSGGASLRRYNEEKHELEVRKVMRDWKDHFLNADIIFMHTPGANKYAFMKKDEKMDSKSVEFYLSKEDERIRKVPFTTKRPTYAEVKKVFADLTTTEVTIFVDDLSEQLQDDHPIINIRSSTEFVEVNDDLGSDEEELGDDDFDVDDEEEENGEDEEEEDMSDQ